jgi:V/A-type H+/Na+-transporting ATPase subunit I
MFKPVRMERIVLLVPSGRQSDALDMLHNAGILHMENAEIPGMQKGRPLDAYAKVSSELVRIRALISSFPSEISAGIAPAEKISELNYAGVLTLAEKASMDEEVRAAAKHYSDAISRLKDIEKSEKDAAKLELLGNLDFSSFRGTLSYALGTVKKDAFMKMRKDLEEYLGKEQHVESAPQASGDTLVLVVHRAGSDPDLVLSRYNFQRLQLPQGFTSYTSGMAKIAGEKKSAQAVLEASKSSLVTLAQNYLPGLLALESALATLSLRASASSHFASGSAVSAITGFVKASEIGRLKRELRGSLGTDFQIMHEAAEGDNVPVALDNPKSASQFQFLVEFYSLPKYSEIDPSVILMFTVPIIYGMILGDVGYGLVSAILAWLILRKFKGGLLGNVAKIWLFSAVASMFFGVIFDEWMGLTHLELFEWLGAWGLHTGITQPLYEGLSRSHYLTLVLGLSVLVGVAQISLGFILGAINAWEHHRMHAYAKIAWLIFLLSGTVAVCSLMFNLLPQTYAYVAGALMVPCIIVIFLAEGIAGLFEIPGLAANTLSYCRIAAVGVVGVIIAEIINGAFMPTPETGLLVLPVFILLHVANAGLAMFEAVVQGGRLNLVEFYSKFYHGGGKGFSPFSVADSEMHTN